MLEDTAYIQQILEQGSQRAFQALLNRYQNRVFTLCFKIIKDREESEEVAQDVFVKCFKQLKQLKDTAKFRQWLLRIAYTKAIDRVRKKRILRVELDETDRQFPIEKNTPLLLTIKADQRKLLSKAIQQLEQEQAAIITLFYLEELSIKEIVDITGMSVSNVKIKLYRARNQLRTTLSTLAKNNLEDLI